MSKFVPLHVHSHYSLLDGLSKADAIAKRCEELEYNSCALTDHGTLAGVVDFTSACNKKGIKPILGCELYLSQKSATIQNKENKKHSHLAVLAKNKKGWQSLVKITSDSNKRENFYYKPRLSLEKLSEYVDGNLIAFSGHPGSDLANCIFENREAAFLAKKEEDLYPFLREDCVGVATSLAFKYQDIFGKGNFFIEIQTIDKGLPGAQLIAKVLREVSAKTKIPCVATGDSHYPSRIDAVDQRVLLCSSLETTMKEVDKKLSNDENVPLSTFFKSNNYHIPSNEEMLEVNTEEEIANSALIADMCEEYNILHEPMLPQFEGLTPSQEYQRLKQLCREGWSKKILDSIPKEQHSEYQERLNKELSVFKDAGLSGYFLIVQDILNHGRQKDWLLGPGRGSAAGCLVSYLIGITSIDPIPYGLIFERFYNAGRNTGGRVSLPDIDMDVPAGKRNEVIEYMRDKYGHNRVAQMITFQRMQGRSAISEVLRAHEACTYEEIRRITKFIPDEAEISDHLQHMEEERGESSILQWALENNSGQLRDWCYIDDSGRLQGQFAKQFAQAIRLEGTKTHSSKHAAGIVIGREDLSEVCPMVLDSTTGELIAGLEMNELEKMGHVKFDVLGVRVLDKIMGVQKLLSTGSI